MMENRANEVGIAVLTFDFNMLTVTQLTDSIKFSQTQNFIKSLEVKSVIFSQSLVGTNLH